MARSSITSMLRLLLLSHLSVSAYAACQLSPRSSQLDMCYASCTIASQCVDQCDSTYCLCQPECLCFMSICQSCCVLSGNSAFCKSEAPDSLALCSDHFGELPVQECNVFQGLSYSPSSTIPGPQITPLLQIADVPDLIDLPSASNCAALFSTLGSPTYQFTYTGATSTATVASYTSIDFGDGSDGGDGGVDTGLPTTRRTGTGAPSLSLSATDSGSLRFSYTSSARIRTPTGTSVSTTTATVASTAATSPRPSSTNGSAPGAAPIGFEVQMMTLALLVIGTLLAVLA